MSIKVNMKLYISFQLKNVYWPPISHIITSILRPSVAVALLYLNSYSIWTSSTLPKSPLKTVAKNRGTTLVKWCEMSILFNYVYRYSRWEMNDYFERARFSKPRTKHTCFRSWNNQFVTKRFHYASNNTLSIPQHCYRCIGTMTRVQGRFE